MLRSLDWALVLIVGAAVPIWACTGDGEEVRPIDVLDRAELVVVDGSGDATSIDNAEQFLEFVPFDPVVPSGLRALELSTAELRQADERLSTGSRDRLARLVLNYSSPGEAFVSLEQSPMAPPDPLPGEPVDLGGVVGGMVEIEDREAFFLHWAACDLTWVLTTRGFAADEVEAVAEEVNRLCGAAM